MCSSSGIVIAAPEQKLETAEEQCSRLMSALDAGGAARADALAAIGGRVAQLTFDAEGCRLVQRAFEVAPRSLGLELLSELSGRVREAAKHQFANYVVQKVVVVGSPAQAEFIVRELSGFALCLSRHCCGCRIICRLVEQDASNPAIAALIGEVLTDAGDLCHDPFGHHVIQTVVEHGTQSQRHSVVARLLKSNLVQEASDSQSSHVVAAALANCCEADAEALGAALVDGGRGSVLALGRNRFGANALRGVVKLSTPASQVALRLLWDAAPQLWNVRYGRVLLREVGIVPADSPDTAAGATPAPGRSSKARSRKVQGAARQPYGGIPSRGA